MLDTVRAGVDGDLDGDLADGMDRDLPGKAHAPISDQEAGTTSPESPKAIIQQGVAQRSAGRRV